LQYNATLKMTTSKYYTPSGRCIQRVDYTQRRHGIIKDRPDTNATFKTRNGRIVRGFAGIKPDSTVSLQLLSPILQQLAERNVFFQFATEYASKQTSIPQPFVVGKSVVNDFIAFVRSKNAQTTNPALKELADLEQSLQAQHATAALKTAANIRAQLAKDYYKELERQSDVVGDVLREEIMERFYPRSKVIAQTLDSDIQVQAAVKILRSPARYNAILGVK
jgi:carboxyl-terminal processing protease